MCSYHASKTVRTNQKSANLFEDYEEFKQWRVVLYKLAWMGFSYPEKNLARAIFSGKYFQGMKKTAEILQFEPTASGENFDDLTNSELTEKTLPDLETEYVKLFISELGGALVPPYGSVYMDDKIMGPSTKKVVERYREAGFKKDSDYNDLPDHVSVELEYLFKLTQMEDSKKHHLHLDFFDKLLQPWLDEFTKSILSKSNSKFYSTLASWTSAGLRRDRQLLEEMIEEKEHSAETNRGFK